MSMIVTVKGKPVQLDHVALLEPTGRAGSRGSFYHVTFHGEEIVASSPVASLDACRVLKVRGISGMIGFFHPDQPGYLVMSVDWGANHTIDESSGSPRFKKWRPMPSDMPEILDGASIQRDETVPMNGSA
jgi:hypothetical protein